MISHWFIRSHSNIFICFLLCCKPLSLKDIIFKGFILAGIWVALHWLFYTLSSPSVICSVGCCSPVSASSGHDLGLILGFRCGPLKANTTFMPTLRLRVWEMLCILEKRVPVGGCQSPLPWGEMVHFAPGHQPCRRLGLNFSCYLHLFSLTLLSTLVSCLTSKPGSEREAA